MELIEPLGTEQTHEANLFRSGFLKAFDRRDGSVAGCQNRFDHNDQPFADITRHLEVIFDSRECLWVAVRADVRHARRRDHFQHAFDKG